MQKLRNLMLAAGVAAAIVASIPTAGAQQRFKTPDEAADALAAAARAGDRKAVMAVLGPDAADIVSSGDAVADENTRKEFVAAYDAKHSVAADGNNRTLMLGPDGYPFPIPLVQKDGSWQFDTKAGREEILARRIGRNELAAVQVCLAYYDAQNEYADLTPRIDGMAVYAQRIVSRPGKKDGLYWPSVQGGPDSPIGGAVAAATQRGYRVGSGTAFHGYNYKVLIRQGSNAAGGALDYVVGGKMVGGFALVAYPAEYGNSGLTTFIINHKGDVFEKDLGANTRRIASRMKSFNPDPTWKKVAEADEKK